jgi:hypothetical protein
MSTIDKTKPSLLIEIFTEYFTDGIIKRIEQSSIDEISM